MSTPVGENSQAFIDPPTLPTFVLPGFCNTATCVNQMLSAVSGSLLDERTSSLIR
jgi:hypothetical protein